MDPIVSPDWLLEHHDEVVVCDVRTSMGGADPAADFASGHLAGARFIDLDRAIADPPDGIAGRHPLPTPERFATELGRLGIGVETAVVAYDDRGGGIAARLVWMLRILGQPAALLDGGIAGWTGELETGPPGPIDPVDTAARPWPSDALADADDVAAHIAAGGTVVDSRERPRFLGETEPIDPVAGHVPGAVNRPFAENLDDGRFRPRGELADRFGALGSTDVVYCGSGVTACHNALAIELAGLPRPRVFVGSWSGWSADPDRPIATGP